MRKILYLFTISFCILLTSCTDAISVGIIGGSDGPTAIFVSEGEKELYKQISAEDAKKIMGSKSDFVILDVREQDEYNEGHIPGAILIPYEQIAEKSAEMLPDKDKQILVYCRSGRRSKIAAEALALQGYTDIKEFGGITDWPYEVQK